MEPFSVMEKVKVDWFIREDECGQSVWSGESKRANLTYRVNGMKVVCCNNTSEIWE